MALEEARLVRQGCRTLNQALADRMPGRSIEANMVRAGIPMLHENDIFD